MGIANRKPGTSNSNSQIASLAPVTQFLSLCRSSLAILRGRRGFFLLPPLWHSSLQCILSHHHCSLGYVPPAIA